MYRDTGHDLTLLELHEACERAERNGYPRPRWAQFALKLIGQGYKVHCYQAQRTVSRYLTIRKDGDKRRYKVRFSNHKPIPERELKKDCDFFVGVTNTGVRNTETALKAVQTFFKNGGTP